MGALPGGWHSNTLSWSFVSAQPWGRQRLSWDQMNPTWTRKTPVVSPNTISSTLHMMHATRQTQVQSLHHVIILHHNIWEDDHACSTFAPAPPSSSSSREGSGLDHHAVLAGDDGPECRAGKTECTEAPAGPGSPGPAGEQGDLPLHHEGMDRPMQPGKVGLRTDHLRGFTVVRRIYTSAIS